MPPRLTQPSAPHYDQYWRLNAHQTTSKHTLLADLQARGLLFSGDVRKSELVEVQQRLDRGLLHYDDERVTDAELLRFIQDRGLTQPVISTRKAMISVLMGADEVQQSDRFEDLPPELRERIHQFHISSLPQRLFCPTQPPVTRVCKLFRKEALPVFHKLVTFELRFYLITDRYRLGDDISKAQLRPCFQTSQFLETLRTSDETEARLENVVVYVMEGSMRDMLLSTGNVLVECEYRNVKSTIGYKRQAIPRRRRMDLKSNHLHELENFNQSSFVKETTFSLHDIYKLRKMWEAVFLSTYQKFGDWR
ncbi:hypothetical protein CB0940_04924 [Cercospora beticola]|uniref:F-box domain-containing protein n=1 Tax=Cercospora beticola TaxID=122368 RepID=A0A2G5HMQ9_CERBT|nr:hypothetical protein CB0940_04924 [Cercospora beticola]PIA93839.1 hypothetical protein CB0940_04924 [Cercospora beticola]WPB02209.1 hypothetical protein RHO25_006843 [Cercospora beticola]CAK1362929.1 unnamed protein product [Cercospora beticola]